MPIDLHGAVTARSDSAAIDHDNQEMPVKFKPTLIAAALAAFAALPATATTVGLAGDDTWHQFNVSDIDALSFGTEWIDNADSLDPNFGTPITFAFTIGAGMVGNFSIVDAGFAGDTFLVYNNGSFLQSGHTSSVPGTVYTSAPDAGLDFDAAFADPANFSQGVFQLGAGTYSITGRLDQSVTDETPLALNSTVGAVRLSVVPVPEPQALLAMLAGLGLVAGAVARRRSR